MMKFKKSNMLAIACACMATGAAWATGSHTPPPPDPPATVPPSHVFNNDSSAAAAAAALAGASATGGAANAAGGAATASGGAGGAGGAGGSATSGPSYAASNLTSENQNQSAGGSVMESNSSKMYIFPAPVWTQTPRPFGCIVTNSKAGALGWNLLSYSESLQTPEIVCTTLRMVDAALLHCQFLTAEILNQRVYQEMYPGEAALPTTPGVRNLSLAECEAIRNPRMTVTTQMAPPPPPKAAEPKLCVMPEPKVQKKRIIRKKKLQTCT